MTSEYLQSVQRFNGATINARLGQLQTDIDVTGLSDSEKAALTVNNRFADFLHIGPSRVTIGECKIVPRIGPIEALWIYKQLFLSDPRYREHWKKQVDLEFIYAVEDPALNRFAALNGVRPVHFQTRWLQEYLTSRRPRDRRAPRTGL
jgi:hypothetical protein